MESHNRLVSVILLLITVSLSSRLSLADELTDYFEANLRSSDMSEQEVREFLVGHWTSNGTGREPIWFIDTHHLNTNYPNFWSNVRKHQQTYDVTEYQLKLNGSLDITSSRVKALKARKKKIQAQILENSNAIHEQKKALTGLSGAKLEAVQKMMHQAALDNGELKKSARRIGNFARLMEQAQANEVSTLSFVAVQAELYNHDHTISPNVVISPSDKKLKLLVQPLKAIALLALSKSASYLVDLNSMGSRPLTRMNSANSSLENNRIKGFYAYLKRSVNTIWEPRCNALQASASALSDTRVLEHCHKTLGFLTSLTPTENETASVLSDEFIIGTIVSSSLGSHRTLVHLEGPIQNSKFSSCESFMFINESGMDLLKLSEMQAQWMDIRIAGHKVRLTSVRKPAQGDLCEFSSLQAINSAGETIENKPTQFAAPNSDQINFHPPYQNCLRRGGNVDKLKEKLNGMGFLNYCRCMARHQGEKIDSIKRAGRRIKGHQYSELMQAAEKACLGGSVLPKPTEASQSTQISKATAQLNTPVAPSPKATTPIKTSALSQPSAIPQPNAKPQISLAGCWTDGINLRVNVSADGRTFNGLAEGKWRRGAKPNEFVVDWPPIVDRIFLQANGNAYKSIGIFNIQLQASRASGNAGIVGKWHRQDGALLEYRSDYTVVAGPDWKGTWAQTTPRSKEYTVTWPMIETVQLSQDGNQYQFVNQGFKGTLKPATNCPAIP